MTTEMVAQQAVVQPEADVTTAQAIDSLHLPERIVNSPALRGFAGLGAGITLALGIGIEGVPALADSSGTVPAIKTVGKGHGHAQKQNCPPGHIRLALTGSSTLSETPAEYTLTARACPTPKPRTFRGVFLEESETGSKDTQTRHLKPLRSGQTIHEHFEISAPTENQGLTEAEVTIKTRRGAQLIGLIRRVFAVSPESTVMPGTSNEPPPQSDKDEHASRDYCEPAIPPSVLPPGDAWFSGGVYISGGPAPGEFVCYPAEVLVEDASGAVVAEQDSAGKQDFSFVLPAGSYTVRAVTNTGLPDLTESISLAADEFDNDRKNNLVVNIP
jgi:hypothetical protein